MKVTIQITKAKVLNSLAINVLLILILVGVLHP
jgi:hypothetical protein